MIVGVGVAVAADVFGCLCGAVLFDNGFQVAQEIIDLGGGLFVVAKGEGPLVQRLRF